MPSILCVHVERLPVPSPQQRKKKPSGNTASDATKKKKKLKGISIDRSGSELQIQKKLQEELLNMRLVVA